MTDSLRDKIIETLTFSPGLHPEGRSDIEVAADAVIAELGLTRERLNTKTTKAPPLGPKS